MNVISNPSSLNIPATIGMDIADVDTPSLMVDLDAMEYNVAVMAKFIADNNIRLRAHAKCHKSYDIAKIQFDAGAIGVCCQKVSEAESLINAGCDDVLVSNQVVAPQKIERLAKLAKRARMLVCVDDAGNVKDLSAAATRHGAMLECLVEIDVGAGRCGVAAGAPVVTLAKAIDAAPGLKFGGIQAYQGAAQHVHDFTTRKGQIDAAVAQVADTVAMLKAEGLDCDIVGGGGTGTYYFEGTSGVYNELQCGSYVFMDADYQRVLDDKGDKIHEFRNSLFIYTSIMSKTKKDKAICDAGLKAQSVDSGMPTVFGRDDNVEYLKCSDEHGVIGDPDNVLKLNDKLKLVPGHCDPTVNVYDWIVGVRGGKVEVIWPVTARGLNL